jgi:glycosyltransferase involved in cell wall biosynthesis
MNRIATLLENPETMWQIAKSAKEKADASHRWINRAQEILKLFEI